MDRLVSKLIKSAKKNKLLTLPVLLLVFVLIFCKHIKDLFVRIGSMTRTKKLIAGAMTAVLVIGLLGPLKGMFGILRANAESVEWDGVSVDTSWYDVNPSASDFTISSAAGLAGLSQLVNNGTSFYGKNVHLTFESINMNFNEFTPIGTENNPFLGSFSASGVDGSLNITKFYSPNPGMGIFANTHSDFINSVTGVSFDFDKFTGDVDGTGTDYAAGAFVTTEGDRTVLYLPDTDIDGNSTVRYKVSAHVTPSNAWCTDVRFSMINGNADNIDCSEDGIITVKRAGEFECQISAAALDPFTYGTDTKDAVIDVKVMDRTTFSSSPMILDYAIGSSHDFGSILDIVTSNYTDRLKFSVVDDSNTAGLSIDDNNHIIASSVGNAVVSANGLFTNEKWTIQFKIYPTVNGITISAPVSEVQAGQDVTFDFNLDYGSSLPSNKTVDITPAFKVEGEPDGFAFNGKTLTVPVSTGLDEVEVYATYTNPSTGTSVVSNRVTVNISKIATAGNAAPAVSQNGGNSAEQQTTEIPSEQETPSADSASSETTASPSNATPVDNNEAEVQSDLGGVSQAGYDGKVCQINYDRYYKITGNVEEGYSVVISEKYESGNAVGFAPDDYYEAGTYDEKGNGTFVYYVRCNTDVTYAFKMQLANGAYSWDKMAQSAEGGVLYILEVNDMTEELAYEIKVPMGVLTGNKDVKIMNFACSDASISKAYIDGVEYELEPLDESGSSYMVTVPFGMLPASPDMVSFNAHSSAQVVKSEIFTEDGGVYMSVTVIPIDAAIESRGYTIHFVQKANTGADITGINVGDVFIDFATSGNATSGNAQSVEEIAGGNLYKAVYEGDVSTDISLNVSPYATYTISGMNVDLSAGKIVFKAVVTAQDGITSKRHTVMLKNNGTLADIVVTPGDITYTEEDLDQIAATLMGKTYSINQSDVPDGSADSVRRKADTFVRQSLAGLLTDGIEVMISDISYTPATAGSKYDIEGTDGKYEFAVTIVSADLSSARVGMSLTIKASEYTVPKIESVAAENGKVTVVLAEIPTEEPDLTMFSGSISINGGSFGYYSLYNNKAEYNPSARSITYYPAMLAKLEKEQTVVISVSYNGGQAVEAPAYIIGAMGQCVTPVASVADGEYDKIFTVELTSATPGAVIYYTTDGTKPTRNSSIYNGPIKIDGGLYGNKKITIIRAFAAMTDMIDSSEFAGRYVVAIPYGTHVGNVVVEGSNVPEINVSGLDNLFNDPLVYTESDRAAVLEGGSVSVWLNVEGVQLDELLSAGGQMALDANRLSNYIKQNNYELLRLFDINVMKRVTDSNGNVTEGKISQFTDTISISIKLSEEEQKLSKLRVFRLHNSEVSELADTDTSSSTYTFNTDGMSLYALGYSAKKGGGPVITNNSTPQTTVDNSVSQQGTNNNSSQNGGTAGGSSAVAQGSNNSVNGGVSNGNVSNANSSGTNQTVNGVAKTGDSAPITLLVVVLIISVLAMAAVLVLGRKKK